MPVNLNPVKPVDGWFTRLGRLLLPPYCPVCGEAGAAAHDLCIDCQCAPPWNPSAWARCGLPMPEPVAAYGRFLKKPPLDRVHAAFCCVFPADRLAPRFKLPRDLAAGRELAEAVRAMLAAPMSLAVAQVDAQRPQALIAVPLHLRRLRAATTKHSNSRVHSRKPRRSRFCTTVYAASATSRRSSGWAHSRADAIRAAHLPLATTFCPVMSSL